MAILTVAELREHVPTTLVDDAVQRLLDATEAEIVRVAGEPGSTTELLTGGGRYIALSRPASAITSITETRYADVTVLAADDYLMHPGGYLFERQTGGTNSRHTWFGQVAVVYTPVDDADIRIGVQIDLFKLTENYTAGLVSETVGSWTRAFKQAMDANSSERDDILSRLYPDPGMVVV